MAVSLTRTGNRKAADEEWKNWVRLTRQNLGSPHDDFGAESSIASQETNR